ncbi:MAG: hypothetical protein Q8Q96_00235, partial [bacterium]|nr:hypothetical protein [bacterium]
RLRLVKISSIEVSNKTITPTSKPTTYTTLLPNPVSISERKENRLAPTIPLFARAVKQINTRKNPVATLGRERKIRSLENKNPKRIRTIGKSQDVMPKYFSNKFCMSINDGPLLEKERRNNAPAKISPSEKIV